MKANVIELFLCPVTGQKLHIEDEVVNGDEIESGNLVSEDGSQKYIIKNYIPRFVPQSNYSDSFGVQWNKFRLTQLDSHSGIPISEERFYKATNWKPESLKDKWVLDVGCGAGRFAEIALKAGANLIALDYSTAVDACYANLKDYPNLTVAQGDVYALPFPAQTFDFVYSLGVLQHTPEVKKAFFSLIPMVKRGGSFCVDFYEKSWKSSLLPKYWLRPVTKRIPKIKFFGFLEKAVPVLWRVSSGLSYVPFIGNTLKRVVPVANYINEFAFTNDQHLEWSLLDTFDWLSPAYDNPQTPQTVRAWLEEANMKNIEVLKAGHLVGRGLS